MRVSRKSNFITERAEKIQLKKKTTERQKKKQKKNQNKIVVRTLQSTLEGLNNISCDHQLVLSQGTTDYNSL